MSYPPLLSAALEFGITNPPGKSDLHGEAHWKTVAMIGFWLGKQTIGFDPEFLFTFATLHDTMREDDGDDPLHGQRAAALFTELVLRGTESFLPYAQRTQDMHYALAAHVGTKNDRRGDNPNVGLCWDADRLTLWRVGIEPEREFLTTLAAQRTAAKMLGLGLCRRSPDSLPTWGELLMEVQTWR